MFEKHQDFKLCLTIVLSKEIHGQSFKLWLLQHPCHHVISIWAVHTWHAIMMVA